VACHGDSCIAPQLLLRPHSSFGFRAQVNSLQSTRTGPCPVSERAVAAVTLHLPEDASAVLQRAIKHGQAFGYVTTHSILIVLARYSSDASCNPGVLASAGIVREQLAAGL
jgi:hypothetical protein